ncbi:hypothetical protein QLH51_12665 [Sphingomonas sp. 2R-10]|nr:hypothetical protein [Sphingomonas sp. 2R-10]
MQIDPNQPIMFDNETMPGIGRGYWQPNPFGAFNHDDDNMRFASRNGKNASPRTVRLAQAAVFTVSAVGLLVVGGVLAFA